MTFADFSQALSKRAGSAKTFFGAIILIGLWSLSGPYFHYNDTWQLLINTSTTIITFLMVFLIQNTQNRDNDLLHIKIDELLRATEGARMAVVDLDNKKQSELKVLLDEYKNLGKEETVEVKVETTIEKR